MFKYLADSIIFDVKYEIFLYRLNYTQYRF